MPVQPTATAASTGTHTVAAARTRPCRRLSSALPAAAPTSSRGIDPYSNNRRSPNVAGM